MIDLRNYVNITSPIHVAAKHSNIDGIYGPYQSYQEALNTFLNESSPFYNLQDIGLTIGVIENGKIVEYWWQNDNDTLTLVYKGDESSIIARNPGVPIYTVSEATRLGLDPDEYISIPDEEDLLNPVVNNTYNTSINGPLANILFSAIRLLLSEVNKLKNTFDYGIYSYNGTNTAMSRINSDYDEEEEPLWAIDDDGVSLLEDVLDTNIAQNVFTPLNNVNITDPYNIVFNELGATWYWNIDEVEDSKILLYFITSGKSFEVTFKDEESSNLVLDFGLFNTNLDRYNVLVVLSKKQNIDGVEYGNNFIWISVSNPYNNETILEGYYNGLGVFEEKQLLNNIYNIYSVHFSNLTLSKFKVCSKYLDFSHLVIPSKPSESNYTYKAAHITIRSVNTYTTLDSIKDQLPENELIFVEDTKRLYIKNNYKIVPISVGDNLNPEDEGMSREEIIQLLLSYGIVKDIDGNLSLNDVSDITFIHLDTGTKFKLNIDTEGNLRTSPISDISLLDKIHSAFGKDSDSVGTNNKFRGFVGRLGLAYYNQVIAKENPSISTFNESDDIGLNSDRVKIGAFYAPARTNKTYGCSHCFIELENTSDKDFPLDGCYMHYARNVDNNPVTSHLALSGIIPAGGTFLIRAAKKAEFDDPNTFIKVTTFDLEWYENHELIDFSHDGNVVGNNGTDPHGFALTYGLTYNNRDIDSSTQLWFSNQAAGNDKVKYLYVPYYIDSVYYNSAFESGELAPWTTTNISMAYIKNGLFKDYICRNTFELDPAKQAYQALTTYDSSRYRHQTTNDYQYLELSKEFIEFPKTKEKCPVSKFTPKASFEHKNVCTDKTQLDTEKPNMVTCSFGKNPYTTRCFNWISGGLFDEYVWIKQGNSWIKFESYKEGDELKSQLNGDLKRKEFSNADIINYIYKRITGRFPASNALYTSHKCIINIINPTKLVSGQTVSNEVSSPTTYTYIVGRADKNGNPDFEHCSEEYNFTLYPKSYTPRIYLITDQQGFHWVEYQVWAAAAQEVYNRIQSDSLQDNIIPVLINTGDMTLSGARINEWLDYYNAGKDLFKEYEQLNVVGNNDLCGNDFTILGTGDDKGKANSYYFHVFYCYEVETTLGSIPIINNKYVPSLYKVSFNNCVLLAVNSEITKVNCSGWFGKSIPNPSDPNNPIPINVYTGWSVNGDNSVYDGSFTSIYTMIYNMTDGESNIIAICHEMPFTVITNENLKNTDTIKGRWRSLSGSENLVGSHLNQIDVQDVKGTHWFSRLLEYRKCKLCIGGHKHTYAVTYPIRENYIYNGQYSKLVGPMNMESTLANDGNVSWIDGSRNLSKYPLITATVPEVLPSDLVFYPAENVTSFVNKDGYTTGVTYFMCQATGFKLMSNKELPSPNLKFSQYFPESKVEQSKASKEQRYPMYAIIALESQWKIKLIRLGNILASETTLFTQIDYGTDPVVPEYLVDNSNSLDDWKYGKWSTIEANLLTL